MGIIRFLYECKESIQFIRQLRKKEDYKSHKKQMMEEEIIPQFEGQRQSIFFVHHLQAGSHGFPLLRPLTHCCHLEPDQLSNRY